MFPVLHYVWEQSPHHRNSCTRMLCGNACLGSGDVKSQHTANKAAASTACSLSSQLPSRLLLCWVRGWEMCLSACLPTCQQPKSLAWRTQPPETTGSQTSATCSVIRAVLKQSDIRQHVPMLLLVDVQLLVNTCTILILNSCLSSYLDSRLSR